MGCFKQTAFLSNLQIECGDETVLFFMVKNKYSDGSTHCTYSWDNFTIPFLPIFGKYDDYGRIQDVVRDANVDFIEDYFGLTIDELISYVDDNMIDRHESDENFAPKNNGLFKNLYFALEHKFYYDKFVTLCNDKIYEHGYVTKYFLEKVMGFEKLENNKDPRYKSTYVIPDTNKYFIHSDDRWAHIVNEKGDKIEQYCYHPKQFIESLSKLTNVDFVSKVPLWYKEISVLDYEYLVTRELRNTNTSEFLSDDDLKFISDIDNKIGFSGKVEDINLSETDMERYNSLLRPYTRHIISLMREDSITQEGEYMIDRTGGEGSAVSELIVIYKKAKIFFSDDIKQNVIDFMKFNTSVSKNSLTYKLSSYGSQCTDWNFFYEVNKASMEFSEMKMKEYEYDGE